MSFLVEQRPDPEGLRSILATLPSWFGIPEANHHYVTAATTLPCYVAVDQHGTTRGVALVKRHFEESAELYLIAVDADSRGCGIGRRLVAAVEADLAMDGVRFLQVKTVGPSFEDAGYEETRRFYLALGFVAVEEFARLDWDGPSLLLIKQVAD